MLYLSGVHIITRHLTFNATLHQLHFLSSLLTHLFESSGWMKEMTLYMFETVLHDAIGNEHLYFIRLKI